MKTVSRRSAIRAMGLVPAMGIANAGGAFAATDEGRSALSASPSPLERAEWHYAELTRLLDDLPPTRLHLVLQRTREDAA